MYKKYLNKTVVKTRIGINASPYTVCILILCPPLVLLKCAVCPEGANRGRVNGSLKSLSTLHE